MTPPRPLLVIWMLLPASQSLAAQGLATVKGTVVDALTKAPLPGVVVSVVGGRPAALTRADGSYRLVLDPGRYQLRVRAIGFAPLTDSVTATAARTITRDFLLRPSAQPLDELVTLGTRQQGRTVTESAVPIDVLSEAALRGTGFVETWQALQRLVPSVNVPRVPLGDDHFRPVSLRGLAPDQVLVLVNGKRRHGAAVVQTTPVLSGSSLVDLNPIPTSAIERIEILRDGAAAQYGSDAVAGVVNVVLKSAERGEIRTSVGQVYSSEGGRDFHDGSVFNAGTSYGIRVGQRARLSIDAELRKRTRTNRAYPDARTQYFPGDPRLLNPPVISSQEGDGDSRDLGILLQGDLRLSGSAELYAFGGASDRNAVTGAANFRSARDDRTVRVLHTDGFLAELGSRIADLSAIAGLRGTLAGWRWDWSTAFGRNRVRYRVDNSNNVTLGNASPTRFEVGRLWSSQWTTNLDLTRGIAVGLPEPLNLALGAEFRMDRYGIDAGEPDSYRDGGVAILDGPNAGKPAAIGSQGLLGFRPLDATTARRHNVAAYLDVESRLARRFLVAVAARLEHYSDAGGTTDGKLAARYEPVRGLAVRAALGTGFRAPSLNQSYFSTTRGIRRSVGGVTTGYIVRILPVHTEEAQILGARPLRPESSLNLSAGLVLELPRGPTLTADFYAIDIDDRIVLSGEFVDPSVAQLFEQRGLRGVAGGRYFTNAIDTRTRGLDLVATHGVFVGKGLLRTTAAFNATRTRVTRIAETPPELAAFQSVLFSRNDVGKIERGQPRKTFAFSTGYSRRRLGVSLHLHRFGETALLDESDPSRDQIVHAKWLTDLGASYQLLRGVRLSLSVNNLFDVYPDEWWDFKDGVSATGMSLGGVFRYPGGISPFGMNGRTVYLHLSYR